MLLTWAEDGDEEVEVTVEIGKEDDVVAALVVVVVEDDEELVFEEVICGVLVVGEVLDEVNVDVI